MLFETILLLKLCWLWNVVTGVGGKELDIVTVASASSSSNTGSYFTWDSVQVMLTMQKLIIIYEVYYSDV